jgi:ADP-ribose pyrophosphatase YjhB (NUDIX family)
MKYPVKVFVDNNLHTLKNSNAWHDFLADYTLLKAAGGIVWNEKKEVLMIKRFGKWEFPKGKVEEGEALREAAVREVREETGLQRVKPVQEILSTYHTYPFGTQNVLKRTYWFLMWAESDQPLKAQEEEGITQVAWIPCTQVAPLLHQAYRSLYELWKVVGQILETQSSVRKNLGNPFRVGLCPYKTSKAK